MVSHESLVETVAAQAHLSRPDEATHVARTVLADLTLRLDMPERRRLRQALPPADRDAAYATVPVRPGGAREFLRELGHHLDAPPERARHLAAAVLSTLGTTDPGLADDLSRHLPADIAALFAGPGPEPARRHPTTAAPAPLTTDEVEAALRTRPAWHGDSHRLERTVSLPPDRIRPLLRRVELATRGLPYHRFDHQVADGTLTFVLYTRSVDAVTEPDLRLADAIDATVNAFGSGG